MKIKVSDKILALMFGLGIVLFSLHSEQLIWHNSKGEANIFLPQWGTLLMLGVAFFLFKENRFTLGDKKIWIPLAVISFFIVFRSLIYWDNMAMGLFGICLFCFYLVGRVLKEKIFYIFIPVLIIESLSCIYYATFIRDGVNHSAKTGGLFSETNYSGACGFIALLGFLSLAVVPQKYRWLVFTISCIGMIFTGSPEVLPIVGLLILAVLYRRDFSIKLIGSGLIILVILGAWIGSGYGKEHFNRIDQVINDGISGDLNTAEINEIDEDYETTGWGRGRIPAYKRALKEISFFGYGYDLYQTEQTTEVDGTITVRKATVHNVPLIILDQVGLIPALCWLWVTLYTLIKRKWKYAIVAILGACIFDHYVWTTLAPYWWVLIGVASVSELDDITFKRKNEAKTSPICGCNQDYVDSYSSIR